MAGLQDKKQPIVIKKIVKNAGHHGGSWKVAFADFATAMMAFFLTLWLMGGTSDQQKAAISEYFQNPSAVAGTAQTPPASEAIGPGGPSTSAIDLEGALELYQEPTAEAVDELAERREQERLEDLKRQLEERIEQTPSLKDFKDQLLLDITPEGLRIQVVDRENRPMFDLGSAELRNYTAVILREIAAIISSAPNRISISGHTDARPYLRRNYSNWELSADRANAARRALIDGGLAGDKVGRVVGLASNVPYDQADPLNPINRRISIIVMNKRTEDAIRKEGMALPDEG
ncbi:MAG: flagellar motor protein MotB [Chromatiales bacterium]|jgi:chemotaxis protein MotB|nr:flagellar motor protein MotB [Chromatiales bacterium]MDX9767187.1 flagellar motor protein MotB [Ectothiorhodospiraceae bacterium]